MQIFSHKKCIFAQKARAIGSGYTSITFDKNMVKILRVYLLNYLLRSSYMMCPI